jgi:hypothetical protein
MMLRIQKTYAASVAGGTGGGALFGDELFPAVEIYFGDPLADIFFALLGAAAAALIHEIADAMRH